MLSRMCTFSQTTLSVLLTTFTCIIAIIIIVQGIIEDVLGLLHIFRSYLDHLKRCPGKLGEKLV